jgi:hypothetical protein
VLASHLAALQSLRSSGLTWSAIASIIARAGGRRKNGRPISADQLRVDVTRLAKREALVKTARPSSVLNTAIKVEGQPARSSTKGVSSRRVLHAETSPSLEKPFETAARLPKDISDAEIVAALARIQKR